MPGKTYALIALAFVLFLLVSGLTTFGMLWAGM